jgi:hypothetical protein
MVGPVLFATVLLVLTVVQPPSVTAFRLSG